MRPRLARLALVGCAVGALAFASGCNVDPYHLGGGGDGGGDDADTPDADVDDGGNMPRPDARPPDAALPDACIPEPEICDGMDQDCDGAPDNGFDTTKDPKNCGGCGIVCALPGSIGTCENSLCVFKCAPGFHDYDPAAPGCEYACIETNGGVEACDGLDNDCDNGKGTPDSGIDEDFNLLDDPDNCGACGTQCTALHAEAICSGGQCTHGPCDAGFADILPGVAGCEYQCPVFPVQPEICNTIDEDCDGVVNNGNPGAGQPCGSDVGECSPGTNTCSFGVDVCIGAKGPVQEICDGKDNDCDSDQPGLPNGGVDEDFDFQTDVFHCGGCTPCSLPGAVEECVAGQCAIDFCLPGFIDFNNDPLDGCEFACTPTGPEVCDGVDNDCDKLVDNMDGSMLPPPAGLCRTSGACAAAGAAQVVCSKGPCDSVPTWHCQYAGNVQVDMCGKIVLQESLCDGLDNDCDIAVDEAYPLKGTACDDGELGDCQDTGVLACNAMKNGLTCNITNQGPGMTAEVCDGKDNDCDGVLDDGAPDQMVHVVGLGLDFYIYKFEAARPDASANNAGAKEHRACSKQGVQPWRSVDFDEAAAACAAAGKRLCSEDEWELACAGVAGFTYPYGNAYDPDACNGNDHDFDCNPPDDDQAAATGAAYDCPGGQVSPQCVSAFGAFDMSGNLKEWTSTQVSVMPEAYAIRGGAFDSIAPGMTCQFDFLSGEPTYLFDNLGFRCCSDNP